MKKIIVATLLFITTSGLYALTGVQVDNQTDQELYITIDGPAIWHINRGKGNIDYLKSGKRTFMVHRKKKVWVEFGTAPFDSPQVGGPLKIKTWKGKDLYQTPKNAYFFPIEPLRLPQVRTLQIKKDGEKYKIRSEWGKLIFLWRAPNPWLEMEKL